MKEIRYTPQEGDDREYRPYFYKFQHEETFPPGAPFLSPGVLPRGA